MPVAGHCHRADPLPDRACLDRHQGCEHREQCKDQITHLTESAISQIPGNPIMQAYPMHSFVEPTSEGRALIPQMLFRNRAG